MSTGSADTAPPRLKPWDGWIYFAAVIMVMSGAFSVVWGIVGMARDEVFKIRPNGNVINLSYTTWGWINLIMGFVVVVTGLALISGALWAGVVAVGIAVVSAIGNLLIIGAYPVWSIVVIAFDILVIYAILVHGEEFFSRTYDYSPGASSTG